MWSGNFQKALRHWQAEMRYGIVHYYNRKETGLWHVLEVRNVKKVFGDNVILRGIDLDVQKRGRHRHTRTERFR